MGKFTYFLYFIFYELAMERLWTQNLSLDFALGCFLLCSFSCWWLKAKLTSLAQNVYLFENLNNGNSGKGINKFSHWFCKIRWRICNRDQGFSITNLQGGFLCLMGRFTIEGKVAPCHKFVVLKFGFAKHISSLLGKLQFHKVNLLLEDRVLLT